MTGVLLPTDYVELISPGELDEHGWRLPGEAEPYWVGLGSLQLGPGVSDPRAAAGGGRGPHGPARDLTGTLYLPPDANPVEGAGALIRGHPFVLSQVHLVVDPLAPGAGLSCWAATVTGVQSWPDGGERDAS